MIMFLKLLRSGMVGLSILSGLLILFLVLNTGLTYSQFSSSPEVKAILTYSIGDGPERTISLTDDAVEFPEEDIEKLREEGKIDGRLQVLSGDDSSLVTLELTASAPIDEIIDEVKEAIFDVALATAGRELAKQALGAEAQKTVGELIESPPEGLVDFLGESYEEVITNLAEGNLDITLEELLSEDLEGKVEKLPKETLNKAADEILGEEADKTLDELLESVPDEIEEMLGEDYKGKLSELFGDDPEKTFRDVIVDDPGKVIEMAKDAFKEQGLEELFKDRGE
jgi:hypothetical protein